MRSILIRGAIGAIGVIVLVIVWAIATRKVSLWLDRIWTIPVASLPVTPFFYDGAFRIGGLSMEFIGTDNMRLDLKLRSDSRNRLFLESGGRSFPLGLRTSAPDPRGRPEIDFVPEEGDEWSFTESRSALSWPGHLPWNLMIRTPRWKRHVYYRLIARKRSGARLEMLWRYEQQYYAEKGWTAPALMYNFATGLIQMDIRGEANAHESAVVDYIARTKHWRPDQYRIENRGPAADGSSDIIAVIYLDDERSSAPGAGQSVQLLVDRVSHAVVKELGGQ